jgi:phenylalanyl-tRNA synthetase beta chain
MKLPVKWLNDYVDVSDIDIKTLVHELTMSGTKAETIEYLGEEIENVVVGRILTVEKHQNADNLLVCTADVGKEQPIQIVTGAHNVFEGALVPVALNNSKLPGGVRIKTGKLRGIKSEGMFCSFHELGLTKNECPYAAEDGILILEHGKPGDDIKAVLGLDEHVIDFEITPNRPDCISIIGLAREAAATFGRKLIAVQPKAPAGSGDVSDYLSVRIENEKLCKRYMARVITDVKIEPSPDWMRMRLYAAGIRPINNIVDITNYVMLEYGQPMHAFDYACLSGRQIRVREACKGEKMNTLDEKERELSEGMLVIADSEKHVAVAGIMGGENSGITETTKTVVFESACFDGTSVRLTSRALGMRTDSSGLFEKGLPPENAGPALARACELVEMLGAGKVVGGTIDIYPHPRGTRYIKPDYARINVLLGTKLQDSEMDECLERVYLKKCADGRFEIPFWRDDIECTADLAEEVARIYGYNKIPVRMFCSNAAVVTRTDMQKLCDSVSSAGRGLGFDEILTYTFISPKLFDLMELPTDSVLRKALRILNPLGGDAMVMRTTALPSVLQALATNQRARVESASLYEIAVVYKPQLDADGNVRDDVLPDESKHLVLAEYGPGCDFYTLKGALDAIFYSICGVYGSYRAESGNAAFHPGRCAKISVSGVEVGVIGEISGSVCENFGLMQRSYVADISLDKMLGVIKPMPLYKPISKFPPLMRDIAVICREDITVAELEEVIRAAGGALCKKVKLFDIYRGGYRPAGEKSVAFEIVFMDENATITDERADLLFEKIVKALRDRRGARLREKA